MTAIASVNSVVDFKAPGVEAAGATDVDAHMHRFLRTVNDDASPAKADGTVGDTKIVEDLISRAAKALDVLVRRVHQLESEAAAAAERAEAREQEQAAAVAQWQKLASGMKSHAQKADKDLTEIKLRAKASETRATTAENRVAELEKALEKASKKAVKAEQLSTKLHDLVNNAFGAGSVAHDVLEHVDVRDPKVSAAA